MIAGKNYSQIHSKICQKLSFLDCTPIYKLHQPEWCHTTHKMIMLHTMHHIQNGKLNLPNVIRMHCYFAIFCKTCEEPPLDIQQLPTGYYPVFFTIMKHSVRSTVHIQHYNFFTQLQRFFNSFIYGQWFSQQFFWKIVVKIFVVCKGLNTSISEAWDPSKQCDQK